MVNCMGIFKFETNVSGMKRKNFEKGKDQKYKISVNDRYYIILYYTRLYNTCTYISV